ncbi:DNA polymerase III subunit delta [Gluconobacter sphaericus NBRC 12467]|uniref:DNA-directed DNA polymerase n=1 Tax=Gluconobacter sphaericus NBRC 12467 TaxID=1307951 RepID=A0AA37WA64_9PROT|nr:DNA polymerase III subunit delta [Gluconobacter sphaericus NBRC 12467]GEB42360.1 DNA polymerase III subunit delta [Gluconobacter sphaericus NBRC 12467]GLQ84950.1 DNA polymerase III subunit delta [Gluconobacter sphaericus NBRC 12467]
MVKIDARSISRTLSDAGSWRAIVLHGEDTGLIRERAARAVKLVAGTTDDPFQVAQLDRETQDRLEEEATALSLIGGRRVVWVREGQDSLAPLFKRALETDTETLIVIEAPGITARSKLRTLAEAHKQVASIACYPEEGRVLSQTVTDALGQAGVTIDRDALTWLMGVLGSDRSGVRGEIEKLVLYAGENSRLDLQAVQDCVGDAGGNSLEDAAFAALCGNRLMADQALERALADGANPVAVARTVLGILVRLQKVAQGVQDGQGRAESIKTLRPPVFFKRTAAFNQALDRWPLAALNTAARETQAFELACKQSASPDMALCRRHIASLCTVRKA